MKIYRYRDDRVRQRQSQIELDGGLDRYRQRMISRYRLKNMYRGKEVQIYKYIYIYIQRWRYRCLDVWGYKGLYLEMVELQQIEIFNKRYIGLYGYI